jgi:hypothetical protein
VNGFELHGPEIPGFVMDTIKRFMGDHYPGWTPIGLAIWDIPGDVWIEVERRGDRLQLRAHARPTPIIECDTGTLSRVDFEEE